VQQSPTCAIGDFAAARVRRLLAGHSITVRERECLLWSSEGKTEADIAKILGISTSTVSKHIASAKLKLDAVNKTHAISLAFRRELLT